MGGWEIPRVVWRLGKSSRVLLGPKTSSQRDLQKMMVEAGGRERTADEVLDAFYSYVNREQNKLLGIGIDERSHVDVEILVQQEA